MASPKAEAWRSITGMPRAFANRMASRTMRAPWPRPRWAGSVNIERRYAAVVPFQFGLGWTVHEPKATAGDGFPADVNDEAGEPIRLHLRPCPTTVDAVRRVEVRFRDLRDRVPHASTMAYEEIQVLEGCLTHAAANHGVRIRRRDLSFPHPRLLTLV